MLYSVAEGAAVIAQARLACAHARALDTHRIALCVAVREARGARAVRGGSDQPDLLSGILTKASVCRDCIERRMGVILTHPQLLAALAHHGNGSVGKEQCHCCSRDDVMTYRIG